MHEIIISAVCGIAFAIAAFSTITACLFIVRNKQSEVVKKQVEHYGRVEDRLVKQVDALVAIQAAIVKKSA